MEHINTDSAINTKIELNISLPVFFPNKSNNTVTHNLVENNISNNSIKKVDHLNTIQNKIKFETQNEVLEYIKLNINTKIQSIYIMYSYFECKKPTKNYELLNYIELKSVIDPVEYEQIIEKVRRIFKRVYIKFKALTDDLTILTMLYNSRQYKDAYKVFISSFKKYKKEKYNEIKDVMKNGIGFFEAYAEIIIKNQ